MENKKNSFVIVILVVLLILAAFIIGKKSAVAPTPSDNENPAAGGIMPAIEGRKDDFVSSSVNPGDSVSGKVAFTASVQGGYFFEANVGVNILDANKKLLRSGNAMATGEWMTAGPVEFSTILDFTGLPKGLGFIEIKNDNPSGLTENDKSVYIPVIIE